MEASRQQRPDLWAVLETVGEFGAASCELIAWELTAPEPLIESIWWDAVARALLRPTGNRDRGEELFELTDAGRLMLRRDLGGRRQR